MKCSTRDLALCRCDDSGSFAEISHQLSEFDKNNALEQEGIRLRYYVFKNITFERKTVEDLNLIRYLSEHD